MFKKFTNLLKYIYSLVSGFQSYISNSLEIFTWQYRQKFISIILCCFIIYPSFLLLRKFLPYFNSEYNQMTFKSYSLIISTILFIFIEIYLHIKNLFPKRITIGKRIFTAFAYFCCWLEFTAPNLQYFASLTYTFLPEKQFRIFYPYFLELVEFYLKLPGQKQGLFQYLTFFVFFLGIGRNKSLFKYFTRYHYVQATLFSMLFNFQHHMIVLVFKLNIITFDTFEYISLALHTYTLMTLVYCIFITFLGFETHFPFMHSAVEYHTGKKKDDGIKPFGQL